MSIGYIITMVFGAVVLLGICIFVHELGHLLGGKMVGIKARVFSMGYGKGILKKQIGDTTYQVTLIPFGGYCQFYGDEPGEERKGEPWEFFSAPPLKRIVPVVMGPLFNLFLGILIFFAMNLVGYERESSRVLLADEFAVEAQGQEKYVAPARKAGIRTGDRIARINDAPVNQFTDIQKSIFFADGSPVRVWADRDGAMMEFTVTPEQSEKGRFTIGVMPYISGVRVMKTMPGSAAAAAGLLPGDMIRRVDGKTVRIPDDFTSHVKERQGKRIAVEVERGGQTVRLEAVPGLREVITVQPVENARLKGKDTTVTIEGDGIEKIRKGIAAGQVKINDRPVADYAAFLERVRDTRGDVLTITNGAESVHGIFSYRSYGFLGVETGIVQDMVLVRYGLGESFVRAFTEPYDFIVMNLKGLGMLFSGQLNVRQNLSGPIFIAKIAGDVAYYRGVSSFIILMAQISIILMIMNLLPIPMVDGSYIVIFLIEAIRKKPLSNKVMERIQYFGMALLILLGVFIIFNDIMKIFFTQ